MSTISNPFRTAEPDVTKLIEQVHLGELQPPDFQRGWVWVGDHIRLLMASVSKSFPIGPVTLETGGDRVRFKRRVVQGAPDNGHRLQQFLLDGPQQ